MLSKETKSWLKLIISAILRWGCWAGCIEPREIFWQINEGAPKSGKFLDSKFYCDLLYNSKQQQLFSNLAKTKEKWKLGISDINGTDQS